MYSTTEHAPVQTPNPVCSLAPVSPLHSPATHHPPPATHMRPSMARLAYVVDRMPWTAWHCSRFVHTRPLFVHTRPLGKAYYSRFSGRVRNTWISRGDPLFSRPVPPTPVGRGYTP